MAGKKGRLGYGVKPPYINLRDALAVAKRIYEDAAGSATEDQLSSIFDNSIKSSSYEAKVNAIKAFGLVAQEGKRAVLTDLARRIIAPTDPEQKAQALKEAFLKIDNYQILFNLWSGKILPVEEFFINTIRERCEIPSELTKQWKNSFMQSGEAAGLFQQRTDGKIQLRMEPSLDEVQERTNVQPDVSKVEKASSFPPPQTESYQRFQFYLTGEGRIAFVDLPKGWTQADVRKIIKVMSVMFEIEETTG